MRLRRWITVSGAALIVALAAGCTTPDPEAAGPGTLDATSSTASVAEDATPGSSVPATPEDPVPSPSDRGSEAVGTVVDTLETLAVKGRAPKTGYDREMFGPAWADTDHNGCDTRNDILARDLEFETFRPGTQDCVVLSGVLDDPYTATEIHFLRGQDTSTKVQIDHVVALSDAWQKGAQQLDPAQRKEFANDPLNLLAVDGPANSQKGAGDAATWLPANRSFRCDYVARQIAVKARYGLWVTGAEKNAMTQVLTTCPGQGWATDQAIATAPAVEDSPSQSPVPVTPASVGEPETVAPQVESPQVEVPPSAATDPQFSSCVKAKAAGYGPYIAGTDPEYNWYRDGDSDGINCE